MDYDVEWIQWDGDADNPLRFSTGECAASGPDPTAAARNVLDRMRARRVWARLSHTECGDVYRFAAKDMDDVVVLTEWQWDCVKGLVK